MTDLGVSILHKECYILHHISYFDDSVGLQNISFFPQQSHNNPLKRIQKKTKYSYNIFGYHQIQIEETIDYVSEWPDIEIRNPHAVKLLLNKSYKYNKDMNFQNSCLKKAENFTSLLNRLRNDIYCMHEDFQKFASFWGEYETIDIVPIKNKERNIND